MLRHLFTMTPEEYKRLNPPYILEIVEDEDGNMFETHFSNDEWLPVGCIPRPRTRLGWFAYHVAHGLAMRYRFLPVLAFSFRHSFIDTPSLEAVVIE